MSEKSSRAMASIPRGGSGAPMKRQTTRPPLPRPSTTRSNSTAPVLNPRMQSGAISPADSLVSMSTSTSQSRSPARQHGGLKRKEREFDADGAEETNIHVVVRCRGRNDREVRENSGVVVSTDGVRGKNVELSMGASALSNKTYHFDKVFSPAADQDMIYDDVVTPILDEMLQGYNCTIFAYGQTGTGKTYTMSGDMSDTLGLLSDSAGIIPRALHSLFAKLEADEAESSVKCSFIELYNEELRDLLAIEENTKLKLFEDGQRKGHSATIVQGMEESHIKSAGAGIKLLQDGSHKRQVAATKCNDLSSRSHTVFTVTVYIKRTAENGEDFVSAGKLNLVDLAGSENIQRSGAESKRAAEAGLINKSLLTLGRVINALVERGSHIPYRESKLTRLLQDSLGGRTKTCIIATVSPAKSNLEETISTLDYAFRAKNIKNKPQVNQTISKKTLLKDFTSEIEKLKGELIAARQRNGVYLTSETYEEITGESESRRILTEEQQAKIETMETNLRNKVQELFSLTNNFTMLKKESEGTKQLLEDTKSVLEKTEIVLADTKQNLAEEALLRKAHQATEEQLRGVGGELISTLDRTVSDVDSLHAKVQRTSDLQTFNRTGWQSTQRQVASVTQTIESKLTEFQAQQGQLISSMADRMQGYVEEELGKLQATQEMLAGKVLTFEASEKRVLTQSSGAKQDMNEVLEEIKVLREDVKSKVGEGLNGLSAAAGRISAEVINELGGFHNQLHTSYSSLGREFKNIFEELVKRLRVQKMEAEELKARLTSATQVAREADENASSRLEQCLAEERSQAAADRKTLILQITALVDQTGEAQHARMESKVNAVRSELTASRSALQEAENKYINDMESWSKKENSLVEEVLQSRDALKAKMKTDWTSINEHNTSIQNTTKSVHEETIRIVDAQMKDMATQMQALDDFVTRARSQNELHHETHIRSLQGLASTVNQSYSNIGEHFISTYDRVRSLGSDMTAQTTTTQSSLPALTSTIQQPLSELRTTVTAASFKDYTPTGETPQRTPYHYPSTLPHTEPHEKLLIKHSLRQPASPSKSRVYTDTVTPSSTSAPASPTKDPRPVSSGLRELDMNVALGARHSDPALVEGAEAGNGDVLSKSVNGGAMGPPPLKRHHTMAAAGGGGESRLPTTKFAGGGHKPALRGGDAREKENQVGRRLRSSQAG